MNYIGDIRFWVIAVLCISAIAVLISSPNVKERGWLLGFLSLSLLVSVGFYVPNILLRQGVLTMETFRRANELLSTVFAAISALGWGLLLIYVILVSAFAKRHAKEAIKQDNTISLPPSKPRISDSTVMWICAALGAGTFNVLHFVTNGAVPGGAVGGAAGAVVGSVVAWLVIVVLAKLSPEADRK